MATGMKVVKVPFKRGTTSQNNDYLGESGEITIDSTLGTLRIHDGIRRGGEALLRKSDLTSGGVIPVLTERPDYAKRGSVASPTVIYKAEAVPGTQDASPGWRIKRLTILSTSPLLTKTEWANGSQEFAFSWSNRTTYNYS